MTDKYFPKKPADVTCATCPYARHTTAFSYVDRNDRPSFACVRRPESDYVSDGSGWCGEHPWFVAERDRRKAIDTSLDVLADRLADIAHDLAHKLTK